MEIGMKVIIQIRKEETHPGRYVSGGGKTLKQCWENLKSKKFTHLSQEELKALEKAWKT